ncbi:MAG: alpha/beta hydrolase [Reyranella sp.]|nr:alpha/beta hydrolase [Reyranella sp.]
MIRGLHGLVLLAFLVLAPSAVAADLVVDGVPLPSDAKVAATTPGGAFEQWKQAWVGLWSNRIKHILIVEAVEADGAARVVYAIGDNARAGRPASWRRADATISGSTLHVRIAQYMASYDMAGDGGLNARFELGTFTDRAEMTKADMASLTRPDARVAWLRGGTFEFLQTGLVEDGKPVRLEAVVFRPDGPGPFPLAVINHGSTGRGTNETSFTETWSSTLLARFLNDRGWIVAFPQRRGRGKSDGLYDEGFAPNRKAGYSCNAEISLGGADRALADVEAAISVLMQRPDVAKAPILIGGQSRGGVLSIAYAGMHPGQIAGVVNFVGGWLSEGCPGSIAVNRALFERGASFDRPTIWLYGQHDTFYSIPFSRENFAAFENAGGKGQFLEFEAPAGQGHFVMGRPALWSGPLEDYLKSLR